MKQGIVIRVDSSMSTVYDSENKTFYKCHAAGNLKSKNGIMIGDNVEIEDADDQQHIIKKVLSRKNEIQRPRISNVDNVFLVASAFQPDLDTFIVDKYLMYLELNKLEPIIIFTKVDMLTDSSKCMAIKNKMNEYSEMGYQTLKIDNKKPAPETIKKLEYLVANKLSIFTGQTGAGKSSTINNLLKADAKQINTQEISMVLNRGKHTTTNVEIHVLENNALVADSPGFSSFDLQIYEPNQLAWAYRIFDKYRNQCKFNDCLHYKEKGCAIKEAVSENKIPKFLYEDYLQLLLENKKKADNRW